MCVCLQSPFDREVVAAPCFDRLWRPEPPVAKGWRSVWDALEGIHTIGKAAKHLATASLDDWVHLHDSARGTTSSPVLGRELGIGFPFTDVFKFKQRPAVWR